MIWEGKKNADKDFRMKLSETFVENKKLLKKCKNEGSEKLVEVKE